MTKLKSNQKITNPVTIPVPLDQCLNCGEGIYQIQDTRNTANSPKLTTAVVAFDSFVRNSRTRIFMRDALKEIYSLLYLVQLNQDSDGCALCVDCCLVFAQLYGLFHTFESRRKSDGFLGSTLKLAFKSLAAGRYQAATETDPSDSLIVIQGISSEEISHAEDDDVDHDADMPTILDTPPIPESDSGHEDVEMSQNVPSGRASPVDIEPASPVESGPASPVDNDPASPVVNDPAILVDNDPASPVDNDPASPVQSESFVPEELNQLESPEPPPSPPVSSSNDPKHPKPKSVFIFKCTDCDKSFQMVKDLGAHRVKAHKADYPYACHLCSYKTRNSSILKPHVVRHSAPWGLKCKICKRLFRLKSDIRHHLRKKHKLINFVTEHYMEGETPVPNRIRKISSARGQMNVNVTSTGIPQDVQSEENNSKKSDGLEGDRDEDSKSNGGSEFQTDVATNDAKSNTDSDSESSSSSSFAATSDSSDSENDDQSPKKPTPRPSKRPKKSKVISPKPSKKSVQVTYKCTDCPEEFTDLPVFSQHRQRIHDKSGSDIYKCHCCFKLFGQGNKLTLHLTRKAMSAAVDEDTSNYLFQCVDCSQKFKSPAALGRHRKSDHDSLNPFVCHFCHYTTPNSSLLKPHVLRHIVAPSRKCPQCDKYFKLKADVQCHMRKIHKIRRIVQRSIHNEPGKPTVMVHRCRKCDQEFDSQEDLIQHRKITHGDQQAFHCDICQALFFSKNNLNNHKVRHTSEPKHKCSYCDKTFYESSNKKIHEDAMHALKPVAEKAAFKCPNCRMSFGSLEGLEAHNESKHIGIKRKGTFVCDQCGMPFETKLKLRVHWDGRHKLLQCPHCDLKVPSPELTVHVKAKYPDKYGPYSKKKAKEEESSGAPPKDVQLHCCDCAAVFPTVFSLRHHRQEEHGTPADDQIMTCHLCKQVYRQETGFVQHVGAHSERSDWPCAHCHVTFTQRRHRNLHHVRDHGIEGDKDAILPLPPGQELECRQGQSSSSSAAEGSKDKSNDPKPFKCLECDAEFVRPKQLGIHRTIAHGCKNEERYQCHICHQFYKTDSSILLHMTRHSERDQLCESCGKGFKNTSDLVQHYQLNHTEDGSKHLREKWKRWRDKNSRENRAKRVGRR